MKNIIYLLIISAITVMPARAQWTRLTGAYPANIALKDIAVRDSGIFAVGYRFSDFQGHIFRSFNNGASWDTLQIYPAGQLFETVTSKDKDTAFIGGFGGITIILRTTDAGHTWGYYGYDTTTTGIDDMVFIDSRRGFAAGYDTTQFFSGNCYYTADGGVTWNQQTLPAHSCLDSVGLDYIDFVDVQTGYAVSNFLTNKYLLKTTDTGKHWNIIYTQSGIGGVYFWNVNNGVMVAEGGKIFKTTNGGMNWTPKPSPVTEPLFSVAFADDSTGFAVGANGVVIKTTNGGETWVQETSPGTQTLYRVKCFGNRGYAVGDGGTVLRSEALPSGVSNMHSEYRFSVYPNPSSSVLNISTTRNVFFNSFSAQLTDMNGKILCTATTDKTLIQMNVSDVPAGTYAVTIQADGELHRINVSLVH